MRNPVHNRRMDFLQSKRQGASHSDFWGIIEETLALIDFQNLTGEALALAAQILYETGGKGDVGRLRNEIKAIESSQWYDSRRPHAGKRAGETTGGGSRWCDQCKSSSHDTSSCWGRCKYCDRYGHLPAACWKNPANKDSKGSAKSALLPTAPPAAAPPVPKTQTEEELQAKKAAKKEKNKRYKERKKEKKKMEEEKKIEEAKAAQTAFTVTSGSEEDSFCKTPGIQNTQGAREHGQVESLSRTE